MMWLHPFITDCLPCSTEDRRAVVSQYRTPKVQRARCLLHKGMGLVNEVFTPEDLDKLKGNIGVGHVRYSTAGASTRENAQPLVLNYIKGTLGLAHNGNLDQCTGASKRTGTLRCDLPDDDRLRGDRLSYRQRTCQQTSRQRKQCQNAMKKLKSVPIP